MRKITAADIFCGAGGTSRGFLDAVKLLGWEASLTAINHWKVAVATHELNHPGARHFCTGIDAVNPRNLFKEGELDFFWASPECTHHSTARGGKPINDQSRATAWCVPIWAGALRPPIIQLENVPEFEKWGPLITVRVRRKYTRFLEDGETMAPGEHFLFSTQSANGKGKVKTKVAGYRMVDELRPDPKRKGEIFRAWITALEAIGYIVEYRILVCANYGDPTTRRRLFINAVRADSGLRIVWPNHTHAKCTQHPERRHLRPWVAAEKIIDWDLKGTSIFDRKKALAQNTLKRILVGLTRQGLDPFILSQHSGHEGKPVTAPIGALTTTSRGVGFADPYVVCMEHGGKTDSIKRPVRTISTAKGGAMALIEPVSFILPGFGEHAKQQPRVHDTKAPMPTACGTGHFHLVEADPQVIEMRGTSDKQIGLTAHPVTAPLSAVTGGIHHALTTHSVIQLRGTTPAHIHATNNPATQPLGAVTANGNHYGTAEYMVQVAHGNGKDPKGDNRRVKSLKQPAPAICGNRGDLAIVEPNAFTLGQQSAAVARPTTEPVATAAGAGAISLIDPFVVKFYGTANDASISDPLDTVTGKDRFGIAEPTTSEEIQITIDSVVQIGDHFYPLVNHQGTHCLLCHKDGKLLVVGIRFRMLTPKELAGAQGFRKDHQFTGNITEQVKQIGNAVPYNTARALVLAALSQQEDITPFLKRAWEEEDKEEEGLAA